MKVFIPSAIVVPEELQSIGKLPAIVYPINQKIVFDYLYEQYKDFCDGFVIECYENSQLVHKMLKRFGSIVAVQDLDKLGDLGYTILKAIDGYDGAGIINFADTIVLDGTAELPENSFLYAEGVFSSTWTFFEEDNGVITDITDRKQTRHEGLGKLFVGVFKFSDLIFFKECLEWAGSTQDNEVSSFYRALRKYSEKYPLKAIKTDEWFDIGHLDKYYNSMLEVKAREFNHITIDKNRGILRKSSDNKEKFIGEIEWYLKLPRDVEYVRPRIFDYSTSYTEPYVSMEYYAYHTIHELFLYGELNESQWKDIFRRIRFVCDDFRRYSVQDEDIRFSLEDMYLNKTVERMNQLRCDEWFLSFFEKPIVVNGKKFKSLNDIIELLKKVIPEWLYDIDRFNIIHGDMVFSNIMIDNNFTFIKVFDPRGKFGKYDIYGDFRYELAKMLHSVEGKYDYIIKDLFTADYTAEKCIINYEINDKNREFDLYDTFIETFRDDIGGDLKKIELINAILFFSEIPLHQESISHQMLLLATGLEILDRVINIREE